MNRRYVYFVMITSFLVLSVFTQQTITNEILDNPSEEGNTRIEGKDRTNSSYSDATTQKSELSNSEQQMQTNTVQESSKIEYREDTIDTDTWYEGETVKIEYAEKTSYPKSIDYSTFNALDSSPSCTVSLTSTSDEHYIDTDLYGNTYVTDSDTVIEKYDRSCNLIGSVDVSSEPVLSLYPSAVLTGLSYDYGNEVLLLSMDDGSGGGILTRTDRNLNFDGSYYVLGGFLSMDYDNYNERIVALEDIDNFRTYVDSGSTYTSEDSVSFSSDLGYDVFTNENYIAISYGSQVKIWFNDGTYNEKTDISTTSGFGVCMSDYEVFVIDGTNLEIWDTDGNSIGDIDFGTTLRSCAWNEQTGSLVVSGTGEYWMFYEDEITTIISEYTYLPNEQTDHILTLPVEDLTYSYSVAYTMYDMINPDTGQITYSINDGFDYIVQDYKLNMSFSDTATYSAQELRIYFDIYFDGGNYTAVIYSYDGSGTYSFNSTVHFDQILSSSAWILEIKNVVVNSKKVVSDLRSSYKYSSPTQIIHKLSIDVFDYSIPLNVYSPLSWNMTGITPVAKWSWDDTNQYYRIVETNPLKYEIYFLSGEGYGIDYARQKQILAISSVSSDYLQSPSFESGSNDDWTISGADSSAVNTSIVSSGSFAERVETTSSSTVTMTLNDLAPGQYIFSWDYYIESSSYSSLQLEYYDDGAWQSVNFDSTVTDRWHTQHANINVTNSDYSSQLRFEFSSGIGVIFIDNNQLSQSNAKVEQVGYNHYQFNYQIVSLDNRLDPVVPDVYSNITLGDRTAQSIIKVKSGYSNDNGIVSIDWKAGFEVKEYYLKVQTSTNTTYSYFTPLPSNADSFSYETNGLQNSIKNYWDFSESTLDAFTDTTYSPENIISENGYIQYDSDTTGFWDGITFNEVVDLSNWNYFVTRVKSNISSSSLHFNLINQDGGSHEAWYDSTSTDYNIIIHDISNANFNAKIQLEDSDRSVSTRLTYDFVYLTNTWDQGFAWEFEEHETITEYGSSENTINGWSRIYDRPSDDYYVSNSIIYTESSASYNGIKHNFENKQDLSDYQVQFEIRSDLSTPITIDLRDTSGTLIERILHEETISSEFTYYEIDITASSDVSYIEIFDWAQSNSQFSLKYIRLIDSSQSPSLEVDTTTGLYYFDNGDNSTDYFQIWSNGSSLGIIPEFQFNYLQYQEGMTYSFTYTQIFSDDLRKTHVQTPSTFYEYPYTVEVDFLINNFNFYQSDLDEFLTFHSSKDADVTIYHNNTQVDTATIFEGYNTISSSRDLGPGAIIFYAALFEDGDGNSGWYNTTISNQDPVSEEEFAITGIKDPLYDVGSSTVSIFFQTNWGNATVHTYQNDTLLASNTEGKASVTFDSSVATYNFTYVIDGGKTNITFEDWYTVAESLGIYQVSIDLVNGLGIGIPFETVAVYSNNSGILYRIAKDFIFENDTISIVTADYFGVSLTEATYKLNSSIVNYLSIIVPIFDITFINQYNISVLAVFTRNNQKMRAVIPANASLSVKFSTGPYHFNFNPIYDDPRYTDEIYGNEPLQAFVGSSYGYNHTGISNYRVQLQSQIVKDQPKETITAWQALQYLITIAGLLGAGFLFYGWGKSMYEAGPVDGTIRFFRRKTGEE